MLPRGYIEEPTINDGRYRTICATTAMLQHSLLRCRYATKASILLLI